MLFARGALSASASWKRPWRFARRDEVELVWAAELGHVVRLGHVTDANEMMYPLSQPGVIDFGPGDRIGLSSLGKSLSVSCVVSPKPVSSLLPMTPASRTRTQRRRHVSSDCDWVLRRP
jgi:hypothetical protein